jgi:hypothetical protein
MLSAERIQRLAPNVLLDIVAELAYWESRYPHCSFYSNRVPFKAYIPTFKFGYDSFLLHHRERLVELLPKLEILYRELPRGEQLKWKDAAQIVSVAWQRMGSGPTP